MEHNHHDLHEAAHVTDEALEGVSGGVIKATPTSNGFYCPVCKKERMTGLRVIYQNREMCVFCKTQLESGNTTAAAASARAL